MKNVTFSVLCLSFASASFAGNISTKLVKGYHPLEGSRTLLSHHNSILAGRTGTTSENGSYVEEFNPSTLEIVSSINVKQHVRDLQAMDDCRVLVTGSSEYSIIDYCAGAPSVRTYVIDPNVVAHAGTYMGQSTFLFYDANEGIISVKPGSRTRKFGTKLSATNSIRYFAGKAWFTNYFDLTAFDPATGKLQPVFGSDDAVFGIKYSKGFVTSHDRSWVAATSRDTSMLHLVDAKSIQVSDSISLGVGPEGVDLFGSCLAVTDSIKKQIYFVDPSDGLKVLATWDASGAGDRLKNPSEIAVDFKTKQIFLRSSYPCPTCEVSQSSLFSIQSDDLADLSKCTASR